MALHPGTLLPRAQGGEESSAAKQRGWVGGLGEAFAPCSVNKARCKCCSCRNSKLKRGLGPAFPAAPALLPALRPLTSHRALRFLRPSPERPSCPSRASEVLCLACTARAHTHTHTCTHVSAHTLPGRPRALLRAYPGALLLLEGARG